MRPRALVVESLAPVATLLRRSLEGAGFEVRWVVSVEEARTLLGVELPSLLMASVSASLDGEALCVELKQRAPALPVVLLFAPDEDEADARAQAAGADGLLLGPVRRAAVAHAARRALEWSALRQRVAVLESLQQAAVAVAAPVRPPAAPAAAPSVPAAGEGASTAHAEFDFFKRYLLMEVKRSRRYRFPVAFLTVGLDAPGGMASLGSGEARMRLDMAALAALSRAVRDIDLAVPFQDGRFLVFLPHTPRDGAIVVAERLRTALQEDPALGGHTGSVGVASHEPGGSRGVQVSFGSLLKDAMDALRTAQEAGGNRVQAATGPKRSRISIL